MKANEWKNDPEFMNCISDLLASDEVKQLADYTQHHHSTRLKHCIYVSYVSYLIAKRMHLDYRATARGGLLHDLFYYDWRTTKFDIGTHAYMHPRVALRNAKNITELTPKEEDIILKHMWGLTLARPKYMESVIVSLVDDYAAVNEFMSPVEKRFKNLLKNKNSKKKNR